MKLFLSVIISLLIISGCGTKKEENQSAPVEDSIPVSVMPVQSTPFDHTITGIGKIDSKQRVNLIFEVSGKVTDIRYKTGDAVKKGGIIAEIDPVVYKAKYDLAKASLEKAESDFRDSEDLIKSNAISSDQFERLKLNYESAKANFVMARDAYAKTAITAPFDGVIVDMNLEEGEYATPAAGLKTPVVFADMDHLKLDVYLSEKEVTRVRKGQKVNIRVKAFPGKRFTGKVDRINLISGTGTNSFKVEVALDRSDDLKLGMIAEAEIIVDHIPDAILIPYKYILEDNQGKYLYVKSGETVERRYIRTHLTRGESVLVDEGAAEGDTLITRGFRKVKEGVKIRVAD